MSFRITLPDTLNIRLSTTDASGNFRSTDLRLCDMKEDHIIFVLAEGVGRMARDIAGDKKFNRIPQVRYQKRRDHVHNNIARGCISDSKGRAVDVVLEAMRQCVIEYGIKKSEARSWNYQRIQTFLDGSGATTFEAELAEVKRGLERKARIIASINTEVPPPPVKVAEIESGLDDDSEFDEDEDKPEDDIDGNA